MRPRRSLMASHSEKPEPSGLGRSTEVDFRRRSLPLPRLVLSPRAGRDLEKRCARCARCRPLSERHPGPRHVAKTTDTRCRLRVGAHLRRHVRPSNRSRGGHGRHDPSPAKLRRLCRRNSACDSPKTHRASEPERFLGHLRLGSPAKVGRFAARPECLPPSTEPVSSVAAACWRSHPCGACQAGT